MTPKLLLIDDDPALRFVLADRLGGEGYVVSSESRGEEGLARAGTEPFDLLILDAILPGKTGLEICRELRAQGIVTPILMLTARARLRDRVRGLRLGADDYLTKPFEMAELLARVEARLRARPAHARADLHRFAGVEVDLRAAEVRRDGVPLRLSAKEFRLLRHFVRHPGVTFPRNELLDAVWGMDAMPGLRTVDVHIAWLRKKIEPDPQEPRFIVTVHGQGYKFVPSTPMRKS